MDDDSLGTAIFCGSCCILNLAFVLYLHLRGSGSANIEDVIFGILGLILIVGFPGMMAFFNLQGYLRWKRTERAQKQENEEYRRQWKQEQEEKNQRENTKRQEEHHRNYTAPNLNAPTALAVLGLSPGQPWEKVRAAWRKKIGECHPDRNQCGEEEAKRINAAYNQLKEGHKSGQVLFHRV